MRFVWPAQRYDRLTRKATVLSVAITTVIAGALSLPIVTIYRAANGEASFRADESREVVTYIRPVASKRPVVSLRNRSEVGQPRRERPTEKLLNRDTGSSASGRTETPASAASPGATPPTDGRSRERVVGPVATPVGVRAPPVIGAPPPPWGWLPPTQAERDSMAREQVRRVAEARDQHRPVAMPLGGASLPLPFLSRGKSREERARDSVIHADNLARLARLAERARLKRDSLNAVNALARLPKLDSASKPYEPPR